MRPRICRCCGESIAESANALSRNPNICASCSSLVDGMGESIAPRDVEAVLSILAEGAPKSAPALPQESPTPVERGN